MAGGETADVGDLVKTIDVGYTAFARLEKKQVITIAPQAGDVIVGLASFGQSVYESEYNSGIGCNGLTSARHDILKKDYAHKYPESFDSLIPDEVCYIGKFGMTDKTDNGIDIGKLLLSPTRTFAPIIKEAVENYRNDIHGIVHNTGGAHTKCLKYIQNPVRLVKDNLFEPPLIFRLIQEAANTSLREMYQVFNMGTRLETNMEWKHKSSDWCKHQIKKKYKLKLHREKKSFIRLCSLKEVGVKNQDIRCL
jgi:phosphoribosylformylglycinamidine cyclo-ligase